MVSKIHYQIGVREQFAALQEGGIDAVVTPRERVYPCRPSSMVGTDPLGSSSD
ncbi:MAG TPA: hypothetical protein VGM39_26330 [Kofleriaceae bacterium]|jgi:hypothetical protein